MLEAPAQHPTGAVAEQRPAGAVADEMRMQSLGRLPLQGWGFRLAIPATFKYTPVPVHCLQQRRCPGKKPHTPRHLRPVPAGARQPMRLPC